MTAIVLQARLDSSRLPEKALLPLGGEPLILRVMEALNKVPAVLRILACPEDSTAAFRPLAARAGFAVVPGSKEDVLGRYCHALRVYDIHRVVRATGDNPFVFTDAAAAIFAEASALGADYAGYSGLPLGAGVETVSAQALFRAETESSAAYDREHVCPYLYNNPSLFLLHRPLAPLRWQNGQGPAIRLTVDTQEDYQRAQTLYTALEKRGENRFRGSVIIRMYREIFCDYA